MKNFNRIWVLIIALNITACGINEGTLVNNSAAIDEEYVEEVDVEEVDIEEVCGEDIVFEEDWVEEAWREQFCNGGVDPDQLSSDTSEEAVEPDQLSSDTSEEAVEPINEDDEEYDEEPEKFLGGGNSSFFGSRSQPEPRPDPSYPNRWAYYEEEEADE